MLKKKYATADEVMIHTGLSKKLTEGAKYALLPGDPGRVRVIAEAIGNAKPLTVKREYTSYLCYLNNVPILICSTGMGGPSVAICVEELARIGVSTLIRIGTTGVLQEESNIGDIIINDSAVRLDGTSRHFAPAEFPAVADYRVTAVLVAAAEGLNVPHVCGTSVSSDTFWPGQERYDCFTGYVPRRFQGSIKEWRALGCTNMEMESATLFTVARVFGLKAGCACAAIAKRTENEQLAKAEIQAKAVADCIAVVKEALKELVSKE